MSKKKNDSKKLYGSVKLIQEREPTKLIGSIIGGTCPNGYGKVTMGFFNDDRYVVAKSDAKRTVIKIKEDVALEIAKHILYVVSENRALRKISKNEDLKKQIGF